MNEVLEDEVVEAESRDLEPWLLRECLELSTLVYNSDIPTSLRSSCSNISSFTISDPELTDVKFMLAEIVGEDGKNYLIIVFRGTADMKDVIADLKIVPTLTSSGLAHSGFHERSECIRLDYLLAKAAQSSLVITGHSLGGATAAMLTTKFLAKYPQYNLFDRIRCVTFGCPLIACSAVARYMKLYQNVFHHFVMENDIVPKLLSLPKSLQKLGFYFNIGASTALSVAMIALSILNYIPFGTFHLLQASPDGRKVSCRQLNSEEVSSFFQVDASNLVFNEQLLTDHLMNQYKSFVYNSCKCPRLNIEAAGLVISRNEINARPVISRCELSDTQFKIIGQNLSFVAACHLNIFYIDKLSFNSDSEVIFEAPLGLKTLYKNGVESKISYFKVITSSIGGSYVYENQIALFVELPKKRPETYPNEIAASILPLTVLLKNEYCDQDHQYSDMLEKFRHHISCIEDSIPIEFAFTIMTRNFQRPDTKQDFKYLFMLLKRFAAVYINDWTKTLCSKFMIQTISDSIVNLRSLQQTDEESEELQQLLDQAFSKKSVPSQLYNSFRFIQNTFCEDSGETIYVSDFPSNPTDYWKCIVEEGISIGIAAGGNILKNFGDKYIFFEFYNDENVAFKISKCDETKLLSKKKNTKWEEVNIVENVYLITMLHPTELNTIDTRKYFHYDFYMWGDDDWDVIPSFIHYLKVMLDSCSVLKIMISAETVDRMEKAAMLLKCWLIESWIDNPEIRKEQQQLSSNQFLNQMNTFTDNNPIVNRFLKQLNDSQKKFTDKVCGLFYEQYRDNKKKIITKNKSSIGLLGENNFIKDHLMTFFGSRNNPRQRTILKLVDIANSMKSNYVRVGAPFFCGQTITLPVYSGIELNEDEPFFNFLPHSNLDNNNTVSSLNNSNISTISANAAIVDLRVQLNRDREILFTCAQELADGISFLNLMLSEVIEVTKQSMELVEEIDDTATITKNIAYAVAKSLQLTLYGAGKAVKYLYSQNFSDIVDVEDAFNSLWYSAFYHGKSFNNYRDVINYFLQKLSSQQYRKDLSLLEMEDIIVQHLDQKLFNDHKVADLIQNCDMYFDTVNDSLKKLLVNPKSRMVYLFFLKLVYHSYHLRKLRETIVLISVNGQKNAGKTTLIRELVGNEKNTDEYIVQEEPGLNDDNTTIFPRIYPLSLSGDDRPPVVFNIKKPRYVIDLPGLTDAKTIDIALLFGTSSDIGVYIFKSDTPKCPADAKFVSIISNAIKARRGPILICITQCDKNLTYQNPKDAKKFTEEKCKIILEQERNSWGTSSLLNLSVAPNHDPQWKCEQGYESSIVHSYKPHDFSPPLSVWLTCYEILETHPRKDFIKDNIFSVNHVQQWIDEAQEWVESRYI